MSVPTSPPGRATTAPVRRLVVGGREVPVALPRLGDPRLKLSAVLMTVQILGQTVLDFKLSIAQILVTIGVAATIEATVTLVRNGKLVWPASAILTGNSVALLLRTTGTQHGDWWSLNGIQWFVLAAVLALGSKYLIRVGEGHVFNPSNVGLVWVLLVVGATGVFPQYLYWGPLGAPVLLTVAVIVLGAAWILRPLGMLPMAAAFLVTFSLVVGLLSISGAEFYAIWHPEPVDGAFYWVNVVLSPEVLIFVFFMISDPQTAPRSSPGRVRYGVATALVAAGLLSFQPTEFGVKLAILSSLTVTCALVPWLEPRRDAPARTTRPMLAGLRRPAAAAAAIVVMGAVINTATLAGDDQLILIERGLSGDPNPQ